MMKRLFFTILCLSVLLPVWGQSTDYIAFKVSGDVCVLRSGEWIPVAKKDTLLMKEVLRIRPDSRLGVLDASSSQVFYVSESGEKRLALMISDAKKQSDRITGLVNQQIVESLKSDKGRSETYAVTGAAYRGGSSVSNAERVHAALHGMESVENDSALSVEKVYDGEDEFHFRIRNGHDRPVYVNVLQGSRQKGGYKLCFNVGYTMDQPYVMLGPDSWTELEQYVFCDMETEDYVLFATFEPYDTQELRVLLNSGSEPSASEKVQVCFCRL